MKKSLTYFSLFSVWNTVAAKCIIKPNWMAQQNLQNSMSALTIILICLVALLMIGILVWYFVIRKMRYPTFKVDQFAVMRPYRSKKQIRGAYRVICSASPIKQSTWERIRKGRMVNEVNNNWTTPVIFEPHIEEGEHGAKHHPNKHYVVTSNTHKKNQPGTLTNKVTLVSIEVMVM